MGFASAALLVPSCSGNPSTRLLRPVPTGPMHPTIVNQPAKLTGIESGTPDPRGAATRIACATCHSLRQSNPLPDSPERLESFHRALTFSHGAIICRSCHAEGHHDRLHLADGREIKLTNAMELCSQCHGPQYRDYLHGSHGGMNGYWDLRRGPRVRNHCVDCHDPHAPQIPRVSPVLPPRDRFLEAKGEHHG